MRRLLLFYILLLTAFSVHAQEQKDSLRKFVVADMETRVPIRDVVVTTGSGYKDTTNYRGVCYIPVQFDTLTIAKPNYLTERLLPKETKDSTYLIPNSKRLSEVTVWGKQEYNGKMQGIDRAIQEGAANAPGGIVSFDLARLLDKRYRKDMKNLKKTRKIFQQMDQYDEDPIVNAYLKTMEEKRLEEERKKKQEELEAQKQQLIQQDNKDKTKSKEQNDAQAEP